MTKKPLPVSLSLEYAENDDSPSRPHHFYILGVGVRQVSLFITLDPILMIYQVTFLNISVYTLGFYVDPNTLAHLSRNQGWKQGFTAEKFLKGENEEQIIQELVRRDGVSLSMRIGMIR